MSAHARMRHARAQIAIEGEIVEDRFGQKRMHPACLVEKDFEDRLHRGDACLELRPWNWKSAIMPPPRKARDAHAESVTPSEWAFMFSAPDAPGVDRGEWWSLQYHDPVFRPDRPTRAELWGAYGAEVVRRWTAERPGTRPPLWWVYDAPEKQRRRVGGTGTPDHECFGSVLRLRLGLPADWLHEDMAAYYRSDDGDFSWPAVDPKNPPTFESAGRVLAPAWPAAAR